MMKYVVGISLFLVSIAADEICTCQSTCTAWGDPHIIGFHDKVGRVVRLPSLTNMSMYSMPAFETSISTLVEGNTKNPTAAWVSEVYSETSNAPHIRLANVDDCNSNYETLYSNTFIQQNIGDDVLQSLTLTITCAQASSINLRGRNFALRYEMEKVNDNLKSGSSFFDFEANGQGQCFDGPVDEVAADTVCSCVPVTGSPTSSPTTSQPTAPTSSPTTSQPTSPVVTQQPTAPTSSPTTSQPSAPSSSPTTSQPTPPPVITIAPSTSAPTSNFVGCNCTAKCRMLQDPYVWNFNDEKKKQLVDGIWHTMYEFDIFNVQTLFWGSGNAAWVQNATIEDQQNSVALDTSMCWGGNHPIPTNNNQRYRFDPVVVDGLSGQLTVEVHCITKLRIEAPYSTRLDVYLTRTESGLPIPAANKNAFLAYEMGLGGDGLCFPATDASNANGPQCECPPN